MTRLGRLAAGGSALLLIVTACGGSRSAAARTQPSASATASAPRVSVSGPTGPSGPYYASPARVNEPPASPARTNPPAGAALLSCRLPVARPLGLGATIAGGFIAFPSDIYIQDPASDVSIDWPPAPASPLPAPSGGPTPIRPPNEGLSYSALAKRWLPVRMDEMSADAAWWAYDDPVAGGVHLRPAAGTADYVLGAGARWSVAGVADDGTVYARQVDYPMPLPGLWKLSRSGAPVQLAASGYYGGLGPGAVWGTAKQADGTNRIVRFELATGAVSSWWTTPATGYWNFAAEPSGALLVDDESAPSNGAQLRFLAAPGVETDLPVPVRSFYGAGFPEPDSHGVFLMTQSDGLWLVTPQKQVMKVSNQGYAATGGPAGPCTVF